MAMFQTTVWCKPSTELLWNDVRGRHEQQWHHFRADTGGCVDDAAFVLLVKLLGWVIPLRRTDFGAGRGILRRDQPDGRSVVGLWHRIRDVSDGATDDSLHFLRANQLHRRQQRRQGADFSSEWKILSSYSRWRDAQGRNDFQDHARGRIPDLAQQAGLTQGTDGNSYGLTYGRLACPGNCGCHWGLLHCGDEPGFWPSRALGEYSGEQSHRNDERDVQRSSGRVQSLSSTFIRATVPGDATSGRIEVTTPAGTLSSNTDFHVLP